MLLAYDPLPDAPMLDMLRAALVFERRFPACFHAVIRHELWEALGDYYDHAGGHAKEGDHILAPLGEINAINPLCTMGMGN